MPNLHANLHNSLPIHPVPKIPSVKLFNSRPLYRSKESLNDLTSFIANIIFLVSIRIIAIVYSTADSTPYCSTFNTFI